MRLKCMPGILERKIRKVLLLLNHQDDNGDK